MFWFNCQEALMYILWWLRHIRMSTSPPRWSWRSSAYCVKWKSRTWCSCKCFHVQKPVPKNRIIYWPSFANMAIWVLFVISNFHQSPHTKNWFMFFTIVSVLVTEHISRRWWQSNPTIGTCQLVGCTRLSQSGKQWFGLFDHSGSWCLRTYTLRRLMTLLNN